MQIRVLAPCFNFELQNSIKAIKKPVFPTGSFFCRQKILAPTHKSHHRKERTE